MPTHTPRKRFGQHFLHDQQVIQRLVNVIHPLPDQHLVEIGPGQGALTLPILQFTQHLDVIEIDRDLIPILQARCQNRGNVAIHQIDALEFDFRSLVKNAEPLRVIGNLPYNISTPLIFHLLTSADIIRDMHFMLQKEVVDRLAAKPGSHAYGRLSVMVQYHCQVSALFDVPPEAFSPPPKVNSSIVRLVPYRELPHVAHNYIYFAQLVKQAFSQRRKTLRNSLKNFMSAADWEKSAINPGWRPEQLSVQHYVELSNLLTEK